jgi:hypothetical protein
MCLQKWEIGNVNWFMNAIKIVDGIKDKTAPQ